MDVDAPARGTGGAGPSGRGGLTAPAAPPRDLSLEELAVRRLETQARGELMAVDSSGG